MKKILALIMAMVMVLAFAACGSKPEEKSVDDTTASTMYKDIMGDVSSFEQEAKLIVFNNFIKASFLNGDKKAEAVKKTVGGAELDAYAVAGVCDMFLKAPAADLKILDADGKETAVSADAFKNAFVAVSEDGVATFISGDGKQIANFKYAVTADGEGLVFVNPSETLVVKDAITAIGGKADCAKYRFVATDKFYLEAETAPALSTEIRGTLSGAVNAAIPIELASGKINDILYVDMISK